MDGTIVDGAARKWAELREQDETGTKNNFLVSGMRLCRRMLLMADTLDLALPTPISIRGVIRRQRALARRRQ